MFIAVISKDGKNSLVFLTIRLFSVWKKSPFSLFSRIMKGDFKINKIFVSESFNKFFQLQTKFILN